jgi:hypothetical protein
VGPLPSGQARPSSPARLTNSRLSWYLPPREVSLTPRTWASAWTASCRMVSRVWRGPSARHSPATNSSGRHLPPYGCPLTSLGAPVAGGQGTRQAPVVLPVARPGAGLADQ